ncbi:hypothetical protein [Moorena sp. SIO3A2]|uniref:hypothetical protein n=1 Tax=Moorena sp. SIO3A2 TaxID=2607841 RepID=UPI0013BB6B08|nr:hypothetical protein [Moorena sp. SIO3A2]NER90316.1 hypothetical protein [Moorena sp. SIO3A2]
MKPYMYLNPYVLVEGVEWFINQCKEAVALKEKLKGIPQTHSRVASRDFRYEHLGDELRELIQDSSFRMHYGRKEISFNTSGDNYLVRQAVEKSSVALNDIPPHLKMTFRENSFNAIGSISGAELHVIKGDPVLFLKTPVWWTKDQKKPNWSYRKVNIKSIHRWRVYR